MENKKLTKEEVNHVAKLANLVLTDSEMGKIANDLDEVINYNVKLLNEVKTEGVEPLYQVHGESNRVRDDETEPSLTTDQVLKNAVSEHNNFFKVKAILEED